MSDGTTAHVQSYSTIGEAMHLNEYLRVVRQGAVLLLCALVAGIIGGSGYFLLAPVRYSATSQVFVSINGNSLTDLSAGSTYAQQVIKSFASVVNTPKVLQPVIDKLSLSTTSDELSQSVTATVPTETVLIAITAEQSSGARAANVANATATSLIAVVGSLNTDSASVSPIRLSIVQSAVPPQAPSQPKLSTALFLGGLVGLALGLGIVFARETLDTRLKTLGDFDSFVLFPRLGAVPRDQTLTERPLAMLEDPRGSYAESIRSLRTSLRFAEVDKHRGSFVLTSAVPGEGKSTTAANLAVALAESGERTLLIDADLRRPSLSRYFGVDGSVGLSDVLVGDLEVGSAIQEVGSHGLQLLPAGTLPPNPSELLSSVKFRDLLKEQGEAHTTIIIDAPPMLAVTDAAVIGGQNVAVLLVCRMRFVRRQQITTTLASLASAGVEVIGIIATHGRQADNRVYGYQYGSYKPDAE